MGLVCLPDSNNARVPDKRCNMTGWGTLTFLGVQPLFLQEASVPIVSDARCLWWQVVLGGSTSWGYGCTLANYYGVYAKVRNMKSWVQDKMNSTGLNDREL